MITVNVLLEGISPIIMNPATDELLDELDKPRGARKDTKKGELSPRQKAERRVIRNGKGLVGIPVEYMFSCLVEAGRHVDLEAKKKISTKESTLLPSLMTIEGLFFPFEDQSVEWKVDRRRGRLPKDGTAICITRPRFDKWSFAVTFLINEERINEEKARDLVSKAGSFIGLGDFRPACRGPFGRFRIAKWVKNGENVGDK